MQADGNGHRQPQPGVVTAGKEGGNPLRQVVQRHGHHGDKSQLVQAARLVPGQPAYQRAQRHPAKHGQGRKQHRLPKREQAVQLKQCGGQQFHKADAQHGPRRKSQRCTHDPPPVAAQKKDGKPAGKGRPAGKDRQEKSTQHLSFLPCQIGMQGGDFIFVLELGQELWYTIRHTLKKILNFFVFICLFLLFNYNKSKNYI